MIPTLSIPARALLPTNWGQVAWGTVSLTIGLTARGGILAVYLVVVSRWLGPAGYGEFAGWLAAAMLIGTLAGWGASQLMMQQVASDGQSLAAAWPLATRRIVFSGLLLVLATSGFVGLWGSLAPGWQTVLFLGLSEFLCFPIALAGTSACLTIGRGRLASLAVCLVPVGRAAVLVVVIVAGVDPGVGTIAMVHFMGTVLGAGLVAWLVMRVSSGADGHPKSILGERWVRAGAPYVAGALVAAAIMEIDKVILLPLVGAEALGHYSVAFRVVAMTAMPLLALSSVVLPRIFGEADMVRWRRLFRTMLLAAFSYGIVAMLVLLVVSPAIPWIFGLTYAPAGNYIAWLSLWPVLFGLHQTLVTAMTAKRRQVARVVIEASAVLIIIAACVLFAERLGATAAIFGLLVAEAFVVATAAMVLVRDFQRVGAP